MQQHLVISEPEEYFYLNRYSSMKRDENTVDDDLFIEVPRLKLSPPCSSLALRRTEIRGDPINFDTSSDSSFSLTSSESSGLAFSPWIVVDCWLTIAHTPPASGWTEQVLSINKLSTLNFEKKYFVRICHVLIKLLLSMDLDIFSVFMTVWCRVSNWHKRPCSFLGDVIMFLRSLHFRMFC